MAGKRFLDPKIKIILCLLGFLILGYFAHGPLYEAVFSDGQWDRMLVGRLVVMGAFAYLLGQSIKELIVKKEARPRI